MEGARLSKIEAGDASEVWAHLYRFSRSRCVLLYKSIGSNDSFGGTQHMYYPLAPQIDLWPQAGFIALLEGLHYNARHRK
jgi:hypothetical protein